ncbi:ORF6N domain-containing protein, partial [Bacteroides ovatus]
MDLQIIQNKIFEVRSCRVMLDYHLAELYQVETRALKQAVKRNIERFPGDFMFVLTQEEANLLLSIEVVSKRWHNLFYILQFCYIFFWLCC